VQAKWTRAQIILDDCRLSPLASDTAATSCACIDRRRFTAGRNRMGAIRYREPPSPVYDG
jgi:hypothetical protein